MNSDIIDSIFAIAARQAEKYGATSHHVQNLCIMEEVGEAMAAYRSWAGWNRKRAVPLAHVYEELTDVLISTMVMMVLLGADISKELDSKLAGIAKRGGL